MPNLERRIHVAQMAIACVVTAWSTDDSDALRQLDDLTGAGLTAVKHELVLLRHFGITFGAIQAFTACPDLLPFFLVAAGGTHHVLCGHVPPFAGSSKEFADFKALERAVESHLGHYKRSYPDQVRFIVAARRSAPPPSLFEERMSEYESAIFDETEEGGDAVKACGAVFSQALCGRTDPFVQMHGAIDLSAKATSIRDLLKEFLSQI
jgi:hypothetical protein